MLTHSIPRKLNIRHNNNGFTLIELLITLTIIAILASAAIPAYSSYTSSSRQTFALTTVSKISLSLESYYTEFRTYQVSLENLKIPDHDSWFAYSISNNDKYSYQIDAIPKSDSMVSTAIRIDHLGRRYHRSVDSAQWESGWP